MQEEQDAPKTLEQRVEALSNTIGPLFDYIRDTERRIVEQVMEIDNDYADLRKTVRDVGLLQKDLERRLREAEDLRAEIREVSERLREFRTLSAGLENQISRAYELSQTLERLLNSKKVVVTRPAQPHELRNPSTVAVRQATHVEIREAALAETE